MTYMEIPLAEFERLHTEIRTLEALVVKLTDAVHWNEEQRGIQAKEIERLRVDNAELSTECDQYQAKLTEVWAEVARLRNASHDHDPQSCGACSPHPFGER